MEWAVLIHVSLAYLVTRVCAQFPRRNVRLTGTINVTVSSSYDCEIVKRREENWERNSSQVTNCN